MIRAAIAFFALAVISFIISLVTGKKPNLP